MAHIATPDGGCYIIHIIVLKYTTTYQPIKVLRTLFTILFLAATPVN